MAFGGEKLQARLVENLWHASGSPGDQAGNTPRNVLAYRVGKGSQAPFSTCFGKWGSDGQQSWQAPLALTSCSLAKDDYGGL